MRTEVMTLVFMVATMISVIYLARIVNRASENARVNNEQKARLLKRLEATVDRMEEQTKKVTEERHSQGETLDRMEAEDKRVDLKREGIASDLAGSASRADAAEGAPGAAADAALRTGT